VLHSTRLAHSYYLKYFLL